MSHVWIHYIVSINVIISNWNLLAAFKLYLSFNIKELNENIFYEITNHGQKKVVYLFFFHIFKSTTNHLTFQMHTYAHLQSLLYMTFCVKKILNPASTQSNIRRLSRLEPSLNCQPTFCDGLDMPIVTAWICLEV